LRLARLVGRGSPTSTIAASTLVVKGLTQALQFVDQGGALGAHPVAIPIAIPALRGAIEARVIVDRTHS